MMLFCVLVLFFSGFMGSMSENPKVVGPVGPLVVEIGKDLVLPCSIKPSISAWAMTVKWIRPDTNIGNLVHLYEDHDDRNNEQMESYKGRTSLFKEELQKGNASLKLSAVQPSDEGAYKCLIQDKSWNDTITLYVEVNVHFKIVGAAATLVAEVGEVLVLPCSIKPSISAVGMVVEWSRQHLNDRLVHLYENYEDRNGYQLESYKGRTALYKEELKTGNTSLKISALKLSDEGAYKCLIRSIFLNEHVIVYVEVKGKTFHGWKIAIICIAVFAVIFLCFTAYILKEKFSKKKLSPAQCSFITHMRLQSEKMGKEFKLKKYNTLEEGYERLIPTISNYRKAQFSECNLTAQFIERLSEALETEKSFLKELVFSNRNLQYSDVEKLCTGLKNSHCKVEILRLTLCKLNYQSCDALGKVLQTKTSCLKELDLSENDLQDAGVEMLSKGLQSSYCKLEILRLPLCNLGRKTCENLGSALRAKNWPLKELDLSKNNLQDSGMLAFSDGLRNSNCKLEILRLSICNFTAESCKSLIPALQTKISFLKQLDLCGNELQDSVVELLPAGLKTSKLEILRLALCSLGEKSCNTLQSLLKLENSSLKELDLSNNDLQDSGVELLSDGLKSSQCKLEILKLSGCMITEKGCSSLTSALSSNPSYLKELDLTYNHPGESRLRLRSTIMMDLRVEHGGENRIKPGLRKYFCQLTLDPTTAYKKLSLSDGDRKVERVWKQQSYPDHQERFEYWEQVLSRESLTGRCYWEAEWKGEEVYVALTYKSLSRKERSDACGFGWNENSWSLYCSDHKYSVCHNSISTAVSVHQSGYKRVGVYVDCPAGTLSFYRVSSDPHTLTHLHTFYNTFTKEPLCAGFRVDYPNSSVLMCV